MSFAKFVERFKDGITAQPKPQDAGHAPLHLATAAVLLEIAYADGNLSLSEDGDVVAYLRRAFGLDAEAVRDLMERANDIRANTIDHFALTNHIRQHTTLDERIEIVKMMWRIVYADGHLTDYEGYLVRKLADLLRLEHHVMIDAKVAVLRERGQ